MRRLLSGGVFCFVIAVILVGAQGADAADKWLSVRSKNFLLVGNASEAQIRRVGRNLEQFRAAFAMLFPNTAQQSSQGTTVIVFKDDGSFKPFKPLYQGKPGNFAGYFQPGSDVNFIALTGDTETPRTIYHEFVHSLTRDATNRLPSWASEGIAEYYSTFEIASNGKEMTIGRAIGEHISILNQNSLIPIATLLEVKPGSPYYNEQTKQGIFYGESWALIHYLNSGPRRSQLTKYLSLVSSGSTIDESFQGAFAADYPTIEKELRDYLRGRMAWPAVKVTLNEKLDFDQGMTVSPLTEAQSAYYLGDLLLHMSRYDEAEQQLQRAISLDPLLGGSYASMGMLRLHQANNEEALKFLTKAVESDSQNHMAHYYYASILQKLANDEGADERNARMVLMRTHLKKSIDIAPRFIAAYSLLGYVSLVLKEELDESQTLLEKAISYAPGREELRITHAQILMANNKGLAARALLTPLRNTTADDEIRQRASDLLTNIASRIEYEQSIRDYAQRQKATAEAESRAVPRADDASSGPPTLARNATTDLPESPDSPDKPDVKQTPGLQVEGFLTQMDCTRGLTLRVRVGNGNVALHTDTPTTLEFISYVATVKNGVPCGPVKPELHVVITYRRGGDPSFLGEPIRVEFRENN